MRRAVHAMVFAILLAFPAVAAAGAPMGIWEQLLPGGYLSVAVAPGPAPGEPSVILAGSTAGGDAGSVLRSTDGGQSWESTLPTPARSLATDPQSPATAYAATPLGLYRSGDSGATWTNLNDFVRSWVLVDPADSQIIYGDNLVSADGGLSWTVMTGLAPFLPRTTEAPHLVASAGRPGTLFAVNNNATYWSTDGGATWTRFGPGDKADTIAVDPVDGRWVYTGMCSADSARYHDDQYAGSLNLATHTHAIVVDPSSQEKLYAVTSSGARVWRSTNRGDSWTPYYDGLPQVSVSEGRMVFDGADGTIYLPTLTGGLWRVATRGECADGDGDLYFGTGGCGTASDCNDADALVNPGADEECTDGVDNDCDGLVDAADPGAVNCPCVDADGDLYFAGLNCGTAVDCDDDAPLVNPAALESCSDGIDNDCDALVDLADPDCPPPPACGDHGDKTSCLADSSCEWVGKGKAGSCREQAACTVTESPEASCSDGIDNDCDGLVDERDADCAVPSEPEVCDDGIDNDGDGKTDCADKGDCRKDPACN